MFGFIKKTFNKIYEQVTSKIKGLFSRSSIDTDTLHELEKILLSADTGYSTTRMIIDKLSKSHQSGHLNSGVQLHEQLKKILIEVLQTNHPYNDSSIFLLVGINGSGKTTCAAKLAARCKNLGKRVLLVGADTFRAAATAQLKVWADRIGVPIMEGQTGQDPASVIFAGCQKYKAENFDVLIIDTAGRLQTKINLMHELEKIRKVIGKQLPDAQVTTLLTIDSMLGQNSLDQARLFHESTPLDGIILTKLDSTAKGGIIFAVSHELHVPVAYISTGESIDTFAPFDPVIFIDDLLA